MTKRWGFYLPLGLQGRGRGSRAVLRWFKQGVLVHDASYNVAVQVEGPEDSLIAVLQMVLVPCPSVQSESVSDSVLSGITYGIAMLHHVGASSSQPIAPVTYMWRSIQQSKEDDNSNCHDVFECNEPCKIGRRSSFCQIWLWIHSSAFSEGYDALKFACQKLMIDRGVTVNCFSREGQLAKLELIGSKAFQLLQKIFHPVTCIMENCWQLHKFSITKDGNDFHNKNSIKVENEEQFPSCAILSFTIKDPRVLPAKRTTNSPEPDSILDMQEVEAKDRANLTGNLDTNKEVASPSCSKPEGNGISFYKMSLWDASSRIDPPKDENELCIEKHRQRMGFFCLSDTKSGTPEASNKAQFMHSCPILLLKDNDKKGSPIGWSVILPITWAKILWPFLVSNGAHAIGLREKHWVACEEIEATASRKNAEQRPPSIRHFRIPIPPPWSVVHAAFDKLSMRVKESEISSGENMVGKNTMTYSSCERSDATSFRCHNSFDVIVARTSSMLIDFLKDIHGEHLHLFPQLQNSESKLVKVMKDKSLMGKGQSEITQTRYSHKLCFVSVHLQAYKEGVFEDEAVICAPCLTDIAVWTTSRLSIEGTLEMPNSAVGSYFKEQSSGKWELQVPEDPVSREYHRRPVGFVTTGFVRGSKKPMAEALCEAVWLACLREEQWNNMPVNGRRKEIFVLVRNLRSSAFRLALATIVLEQQREDLRFL